jgi:hypothetical protein
MRLLSLPTKDASDPRAPHREFWPQMVRKHRKAPVSFSSMRHSNGQGIGRSYGANAYNVLQECYRHLHQAYSPGHTPMSKRPKGLGISWKPTHTFRLSLPNQSRLRAKDTTPNTRAIPSTREASKFGTTSAFACLSLAGSRPGLLSSPYYLPSAPTLKARDRHDRFLHKATTSNWAAPIRFSF